MSLKKIYASTEEQEMDVPVTDEELTESEASVESAEVELTNAVVDEETVETVTTGLEELVASLEGLVETNSVSKGNLRVVNTAYRGLMSHFTPNVGNVVSSFEEAVAVVEVDTVEDKNETETTAVVDVTEVIPVIVSIEALDNIKAKLAKAGAVAKEAGKKVWEKILEVLKRIMEFFDFAGKRAKVLKTKVNGLKDSDRKEGEFKVPNAAALSHNGTMSVASTKLAVEQLLINADLVLDISLETIALKQLSPETPGVLKAMNKLNDLIENLPKTQINEAGRYTGEVASDTWKRAPGVSDLKEFLAMSEKLIEFKRKAGEFKGALEKLNSSIDDQKRKKLINLASQYGIRVAKTTRNLQKVVEAGLKAYGESAPAVEEPKV